MMSLIIEKLKKIVILPKYLLIERKIRHENCIALVGTSTYNNLGDHLLSRNSVKFLKHNFSDRLIVEVPTQVFKRYETELSKAINNKAIVVISAGGWMGNLWPEDELIMQKIIRIFSRHKIIILPQTVFYDDTLDNYEEILSLAKDAYSACVDLTLFVRESNSLNTAKNILDIEQIYLAPDMGMYNYKNKSDKGKQCQALICLRNDREAQLRIEMESIINDFLHSMKYKIGYFNTVEKHNISNFCRNLYLFKLEKKLSGAKIVFTDRLHGMILAVNNGCKCVAFDNKNHKVSGVYKSWLKNNPNVLLVDDDQLELSRIVELMDSKECAEEWSAMIDLEFKNMAKIMKGEL